MRALLILNDAAGSLNGDRGAASPAEVAEALTAAGVTVDLRPSPANQLVATLQAASAERPDVIFVGGGDGTINTAAGCLVDTRIALGVLPLGTFNHFARDLGLPADWREAVTALAHGVPRAVDVGEVNGRVFINNCSVGSYPEAVRRRDELRQRHGSGKWFAMALASIAVFRRLRRLRVRIKSPEATFTLRTPFVFVGNNAYSGHVFGPSLRPQLDAGHLWIYTTRAHRRLTLLRLMGQSLFRRIDASDALDSRAVSEALIESTHGQNLPLAVDGELLPPTPSLRFRLRRRALHVIAPVPTAA